VALNRAVAVAMATSAEEGLRLLDDGRFRDELAEYHLYHAARADLLRRSDRKIEASDAYRRAIALTTNDVERIYLESGSMKC